MKKFFKEDFLDLEQAMADKEYFNAHIKFEEEEDERVHEVPELTSRLKELIKVKY